MKLKLTQVFYIFLYFITSCKTDTDSSTARKELRDLLHGKYQLVQATADQNVDINMDGVSSSEIVTEISDLKYAYLELRISEMNSSNFFSLSWPEQYVNQESNPDKPFVMYYIQSRPYEFKYISEERVITLDTTEISEGYHNEPEILEPVKVRKDGLVEVVFSKEIYTSTGWKKLTINALYKRFTNLT